LDRAAARVPTFVRASRRGSEGRARSPRRTRGRGARSVPLRVTQRSGGPPPRRRPAMPPSFQTRDFCQTLSSLGAASPRRGSLPEPSSALARALAGLLGAPPRLLVGPAVLAGRELAREGAQPLERVALEPEAAALVALGDPQLAVVDRRAEAERARRARAVAAARGRVGPWAPERRR